MANRSAQHMRRTKTFAGGARPFPHWERMLIFSTDGSDPRSNGRTYHIALTVTFHPLVQAFILFVTVFTVFLERKRLAAWLPARGDVGLAGVGAAVGIILALVAWGLVPTINADAGPPKDWPLVVSILLHIGMGTGLFASVVATGICATMLVLRRRDVAPSEAVLIGYPVALAVTVAIAAVAVVAPGWMLAGGRPAYYDLAAGGFLAPGLERFGSHGVNGRAMLSAGSGLRRIHGAPVARTDGNAVGLDFRRSRPQLRVCAHAGRAAVSVLASRQRRRSHAISKHGSNDDRCGTDRVS